MWIHRRDLTSVLRAIAGVWLVVGAFAYIAVATMQHEPVIVVGMK